jgi:putative ATP-binding cassette transporter
MDDQPVALKGQNWARFAHGVKKFTTSPVGGKAVALFGGLVAMLLGINGLNVVNSYVGRDFMTAIAERDSSGFIRWAILYIGVFAASTVLAVFLRFMEERLGLLWREWLTRRLITRYLEDQTFYCLDKVCKVANPDQRIAEDVRAFTGTTLSFFLMLLNGTLTVLAFVGVMWSISPLLFAVAVVYAVAGTLLTIALGRPLVALSYSQSDKEANFRSDLIHIRENAELIALARREGRLSVRLLNSLDALVANSRRIISVNRNLGFFTTGYNYLIQIIPALVVAPLFLRGEVAFGVIPQSAMAFAHLMGAFSLIVTQFQSISSFAAVIARLGSLMEGMDRAKSASISAITVEDEADGRLAYEGLTLRAPPDDRVVVKDLSITIPVGTRVLILGADATAKVALFRATAGVWQHGEGRIIRPRPERVLFISEHPYLPPGTLREVLLRTGQEQVIKDEPILATLRTLDLEPILARTGGLDTEQDWDNILSLGEQQLIAFARILIAAPRFAFLDRASTALTTAQVAQILAMLTEHGITYINVDNSEEPMDGYDAILELRGDGGWTWQKAGAVR